MIQIFKSTSIDFLEYLLRIFTWHHPLHFLTVVRSCFVPPVPTFYIFQRLPLKNIHHPSSHSSAKLHRFVPSSSLPHSALLTSSFLSPKQSYKQSYIVPCTVAGAITNILSVLINSGHQLQIPYERLLMFFAPFLFFYSGKFLPC